MSSNGGFPIVILVYRSVFYSYLACPRVGSGSLGSTTAVPTSEISQDFGGKLRSWWYDALKFKQFVWVNIRKSKQKKISEFQLVSWDQDFMTFILGSIHIMNGLFSWQEWLHINLYIYIYNWHHQQSIYFVSTSKVGPFSGRLVTT